VKLMDYADFLELARKLGGGITAPAKK